MNDEMLEVVPVEKSATTSHRFREVQFLSLAEKIANDQLYYRNYYYPGGRESFPEHKQLQCVDKYFPYAEGGPLFIDEVSRTDDVKMIEAKEKRMQTLGHRYVAILPGMTELDIRERIS